jgi:hypothetical protein
MEVANDAFSNALLLRRCFEQAPGYLQVIRGFLLSMTFMEKLKESFDKMAKSHLHFCKVQGKVHVNLLSE